MNEFVGKKIGEVLAFCTVGTDTISKGRPALVTALGEEKVLEMEEKNHLYAESLKAIALEGNCISVTDTKAAATHDKLVAMRDLYVHGQWDNATELMEWSGFFEGAAVVHFALIRGVAEAINHENLLLLAEEATTWHYDLIDLAESYLSAIGQDKAVQ